MISTVRGTIRDIALDHVVIEIGGAASGVGLAVRTTPGVLAGLRTDTETTLATGAGWRGPPENDHEVAGAAGRGVFGDPTSDEVARA
jgi:Holliday junction DNA helicase RuvA